MNKIAVKEKPCTECGETKPLSEYHRRSDSADGHQHRCGDCARLRARQSRERRRAEMGEEAWLEYQRQQVARSRAKPDVRAKQRRLTDRRTRATSELIANHRREFDSIMARLRYEDES